MTLDSFHPHGSGKSGHHITIGVSSHKSLKVVLSLVLVESDLLLDTISGLFVVHCIALLSVLNCHFHVRIHALYINGRCVVEDKFGFSMCQFVCHTYVCYFFYIYLYFLFHTQE